MVEQPVSSTQSSPSSHSGFPPSFPSSPDAEGPNPLLATLKTSLSTLDKDVGEQKAKLGLIDKRLELLQKASDRSDRIEDRKVREKKERDEKDKAAAAAASANGDDPVKAEDAEEEKEKPVKPKSKKTDAAATGSADRECGFDRRLVLGEREFAEWCESEEGLRTLSVEGEDKDKTGEGESGVVMDGMRWWCEETRKKCDGHAGYVPRFRVWNLPARVTPD